MRSPLTYLALIFLFTTSCKKDLPVDFGNYPPNIEKIIGNTCAISGCHNAKSYLSSSGFNLETWFTMFCGSSNGSPVIPYSSKFSSFCNFINTYSDLGLQNVPSMPLNKNPLSHDDVTTIKNWIDAGAPDIKGNIMWADNTLRKKAYAANQGCDVITVFDCETQLPMRFIEVGGRPGVPDTPHQIRVSPDGKYWYVVFINKNVMEKHRCSDDAFVANIPLTPYAAGTSTDPDYDALNWNTFIISKDSKRAYCVSLSSYISAVDLENENFLHFSKVSGITHASALSNDNTLFYVGAQTGNYITQWDTAFANGGYQISLQNGVACSDLPSLDIHDMLLDSINKNLWVTCQGSNEVRIFNITQDSVTAVIPVGYFPQDIVYSSSTNQYFVSFPEDTTTFHGQHGIVSKINPSGFSVTNIKCGYQPHGIGVDENKKLLYVLSRNISTSGPLPHHTSVCTGRDGFVNFVDLNTLNVSEKKYELASDPYFVFIRP